VVQTPDDVAKTSILTHIYTDWQLNSTRQVDKRIKMPFLIMSMCICMFDTYLHSLSHAHWINNLLLHLHDATLRKLCRLKHCVFVCLRFPRLHSSCILMFLHTRKTSVVCLWLYSILILVMFTTQLSGILDWLCNWLLFQATDLPFCASFTSFLIRSVRYCLFSSRRVISKLMYNK